MLVSDLKLPKGVEVLADPEQVVVTILAPQKELTEEEAEDAAVEADRGGITLQGSAA